MASGTEFQIEIAQRLTGASVVTELQSLEATLVSAKSKYADLEREALSFQKAIDRNASALGSVRAQMAAAMQAGDPAKFWKLATAMQALEKQEAALASKSAEAKGALDAQGRAVLEHASQIGQMRKAQEAANVDLAGAGGALKKLGGPLGKVGDTINDTVEGFEKLQSSVGTEAAVALGFVAAAVAVVAVLATLAIGAIAAGAAFAKWSIQQADTTRELALTTRAMADSDAAGSAMLSTFSAITAETGIAAGRLNDLTGSLREAGVSAADMPDALRGIAIQEAALGNQNGTQKLIDDLREGQTTARALANDMDARLGGVVQDRMLGLNEQMQTLDRNLSNTFAGENIKPFLEGLARLVALTDSSTESGRAMKAIFESIFQPLIDGSGGAFIQIERFILGAEIEILKLAILVKKMAKEFDFDTSGLTGIVDAADLGKIAVIGVLVVLGGLLAVMGLVAIAGAVMFVPMLAALLLILSPLILFAAVIYGIYETANFLKNLDWEQIGNAIVDGILGPIRDPAKVATAFADMGENAITSLKDKLGIHSPAAEAIKIRENWDDTLATPTASAAGALDVPAPKGPKGEGRGYSGPLMVIESIIIQGGASAEETLDRLEERLDEYAQKLLLMIAADRKAEA